MMNRPLQLLLIFFLIISFSVSAGNKPKAEINIDEQLGKQVPLNVSFYDSEGNKVLLKDLVNKTTVLAFVYYKCPGICSPLMSEISNIVNKSDLEPGKDYNIITISMDDRETQRVAKEKKQNFLSLITKNFPSTAWSFLTGDSLSIREVTKAAGFHFERVGAQFIHTTSLIFLTADGKISRYLYPGYNTKGDFNVLPFNFKMAVIDASEGKVIPTVGKVLAFCFSYDPKGKTYVFNLLKVFGVGTLILIGVFVIFLRIKPK